MNNGKTIDELIDSVDALCTSLTKNLHPNVISSEIKMVVKNGNR